MATAGHSLFLGDLQVLSVALQGSHHLPQLNLGVAYAAVQVPDQFVLVGYLVLVPFQNLLKDFLSFLEAPISTATGQHWGWGEKELTRGGQLRVDRPTPPRSFPSKSQQRPRLRAPGLWGVDYHVASPHPPPQRILPTHVNVL